MKLSTVKFFSHQRFSSEINDFYYIGKEREKWSFNTSLKNLLTAIEFLKVIRLQF